MNKTTIISNNEHMLNIQTYYYSRKHINNNYKYHIAYIDNNVYTKSDTTTFNKTSTIYNKTNQYTTDVLNNCKLNKVPHRNKTCYNLIEDVVTNTHNAIYTTDNNNITNIDNTYNYAYTNYATKKL